jgi:hypothetical protein
MRLLSSQASDGGSEPVSLVPSYSVGSLAAQRAVPCWPDPSRAMVLLTRGVDRFTSDLLLQMPFVFALLFVFDDFIDRVLRLIGYDHLVLLQPQYLYLSKRLTDIRFVDFQVFEITLWLSIAIWGLRLILEAAFLKQYDRFFMTFSEPNKLRAYAALIIAIPVIYALLDVKLAFAARLTFVLMKYFPDAYFVLFATLLFWCMRTISANLLFITWKIFRQNWPGVTLWCDDLQ